MSELLSGLSMLTVIQIKNRADELIRAAWRDGNGKYKAALLIPPYGRILVSTDASFDTEEAGRAHVDALVKACVETL